MRFLPTPLEGVYVVELNRQGDHRGFFARLFCAEEFAAAGLMPRFVQINNSLTARRGSVRGLHYQLPPAAEVKVARCLRGALFDVVADLRPDSPSYGRWFGTELNAENRSMMYVPGGCAHGFMTLADDTETLYLASTPYTPQLERGIRFDDPWLAVDWPGDALDISAKDRAWPDFDPLYHGVEQLRGIVSTPHVSDDGNLA